jgi:ABC-2 type transport system ATP-binding protein
VELQDLHALAAELLKLPGVEMVAPFGASLHVGGRDHAALEAAIAPWRSDPRYVWRVDEPSLEDVFIDLMSRAQDNFP